jgi:hypothetical protein
MRASAALLRQINHAGLNARLVTLRRDDAMRLI